MSNEDDKLLEDYLAGDSDLSRRYREEAGGESPPPEIDDRLRAAARREVRAGPSRLARWQRTWTAPLATAAVLVLAVGVTLLTLRQPNAPPTPAQSPTAQPQSGAAGSTAPRSQGIQQLQYAPRTEEAAPRSTMSAPQPGAAGAAAPSEGARLRRTAPEKAPAAGSPAAASNLAAPKDYQADPGTWLAHVRALAAKGDSEAARDSLVQFTKHYPNYPVPDDLTPVLK
jgi:type IV secretory pathway VirB10-like protein